MDIFGMFLNSAFDWGVGKILDVTTSCVRCSQRESLKIANISNNYLSCRNCHSTVQQYTNACDFTVNKTSLEIGQTQIWTPYVDFSWEKSNRQQLDIFDKLLGNKNVNGLYSVQNNLVIEYSFRALGLLNQHLVINIDLKDYKNGRLITNHNNVALPTFYDNIIHNSWFSFPIDKFKNFDNGSTIISAEITIQSIKKQKIGEQIRLLKPFT